VPRAAEDADLMSNTISELPEVLRLRPGELVRVRSAAEIFSTLDERGMLNGLPFMPEMIEYCGQVLPVFKRADKTCAARGGTRRMFNTVHLGNIRCNGAAHGGCQAACLMHWKEAWLERVEPDAGPAVRELDTQEEAFVNETLLPAATVGAASVEADRVYQCQATRLYDASTPFRLLDVEQYPADARNWGWPKVLRSVLIEVYNKVQSRRLLPRPLRIRGGQTHPFLRGQLEKDQVPTLQLDLQPGELVRIKSRQEILATLDRTNRNRGLSFDVEMLRYCGQTARVQARVSRVIDEVNGKMIPIARDCIILEGVVCKSDYHQLCTRSIYPYWREIWLERG
jgi:hypothetical protein